MKFGAVGILLGAFALLVAALPMAQAASDGLPAIDLKTRCKKSENTMIDMMADKSLQGTAYDLCMKSEGEARDAMQKAWHEIPTVFKSFCIKPDQFSPSYIEWIACLEMLIDLKKQRATTGAKMRDAPGRCPYIQYADDGSIKRIVACSLGGNKRS